MKSLWQLAILLVSFGVVFTSCDPDPVDPPVDDNFSPSITLLTENPNPNSTTSVISSDVTLQFSEPTADGTTIVVFGIEGSDSTPTLSNLSITRNGVTADDLVVSITDDAGVDIGNNNPALIVSPADSLGFRWEVLLRTDAAYGENVFTFTLTDSGSLTAETSVIVTTEEYVNPGTVLAGNLSGVLLNQSGPMGTGGLDLDNGEGLGSSDVAIEIKDNGSDFSLPAASNWRQTISGANGTEIRVVNAAALGDTYNYTDVTYVEEVLAAWDSGIALAGEDTDVLSAGDELVMYNATNDRHYLLQVVEVNITTADGDNGDNYVFNIKY